MPKSMRDVHRFHLYSLYFAPRGRERLLSLGEQLSHRHLSYSDKLIGIVGDAGSGKSLIIKGMFPGLILSNDDDTIDPHKIMQVRNDLDRDYRNSTYHLDMRFQLAFTQMFEVVDFVRGALAKERRVIIEHFDLLYPYLKMNADIIVGIGEEIIVTRPNIFGPLPKDIYDIVFTSLKYRKMAHTAEDLTQHILSRDYNIPPEPKSGDVRRGFVLNFSEKPSFDILELEIKVRDLIVRNLDISYHDENHIQIGEELQYCTGPRFHVRNTSEVENFRLINEIFHDEATAAYSLVGLVSDKYTDVSDLNKIS